MKKLDHKTVFITGGLSGIGKACAIAAAKEGANIAIADLPSANSGEFTFELERNGINAIFCDCDVSVAGQVQSSIQKVVSHFGSLDVALNNAGIGGEANKTADMSETGWLNVINVNLNGVFYCMKYELQQMQQQKSGCIINMSSILGKAGFASAGHYVAAKHGILGLTQTAALEYVTDGIRVNAICPGFIETPLLAKGGITDHPEIKQHIIDLHPMKRLGRADEIAGGFLYLASADSSFVTGTSLVIDGGFLTP
jgi:NAD(P)-dependent dehydrogenase (short-subunit alcohol dehydrogenase family)